VLVQLNGDDDATVPEAAGDSEGDDARYLLLDEPTASLDAAHAHMVLKIARREARRSAEIPM
jgi:ABC-type hemin transport system ATPase subunit